MLNIYEIAELLRANNFLPLYPLFEEDFDQIAIKVEVATFLIRYQSDGKGVTVLRGSEHNSQEFQIAIGNLVFLCMSEPALRILLAKDDSGKRILELDSYRVWHLFLSALYRYPTHLNERMLAKAESLAVILFSEMPLLTAIDVDELNKHLLGLGWQESLISDAANELEQKRNTQIADILTRLRVSVHAHQSAVSVITPESCPVESTENSRIAVILSPKKLRTLILFNRQLTKFINGANSDAQESNVYFTYPELLKCYREALNSDASPALPHYCFFQLIHALETLQQAKDHLTDIIANLSPNIDNISSQTVSLPDNLEQIKALHNIFIGKLRMVFESIRKTGVHYEAEKHKNVQASFFVFAKILTQFSQRIAAFFGQEISVKGEDEFLSRDSWNELLADDSFHLQSSDLLIIYTNKIAHLSLLLTHLSQILRYSQQVHAIHESIIANWASQTALLLELPSILLTTNGVNDDALLSKKDEELAHALLSEKRMNPAIKCTLHGVSMRMKLPATVASKIDTTIKKLSNLIDENELSLIETQKLRAKIYALLQRVSSILDKIGDEKFPSSSTRTATISTHNIARLMDTNGFSYERNKRARTRIAADERQIHTSKALLLEQ